MVIGKYGPHREGTAIWENQEGFLKKKTCRLGTLCPHKVRIEKEVGSRLRTEHIQGQMPTDNVKNRYRLMRGNGCSGE